MGTTTDTWTCAGVTSTGAITATSVSSSGAITGTSLTLSGVPSTTDSNAKLKEIFIPWQAFITAQTTGAATTLVSDGVGAPVSQGNLNTSGISGISLDDANDTVATVIPVPYDMDVTAACSFEVPMHFAAAMESGDTITLALLYTLLTANTTALIAAATAASPDFGARAWAVDNAIHVATGATIAANTLVVGRYLNLTVKVGTVGSFSDNEVSFLGLKMIYTRRYL